MRRVIAISVVLIIGLVLIDASNAQENKPLNFQKLYEFMVAADKGDLTAVRNALDHGQDVNEIDPDACSALFHALGRFSRCGFGLNNLYCTTTSSLIMPKPLTPARQETALYLISHGADVNYQDPIYQCTPLTLAAIAGNVQVVDELLRRGAKVNIQTIPLIKDVPSDHKVRTPLAEAARNGNPQVVKLLIEHGAEVNRPFQQKGVYGDGYTPLCFAVSQGHLEATKVLLDNGAEVNVKLPDGKTVLALAESRKDNEEISALLKEHGGTHDDLKESDAGLKLEESIGPQSRYCDSIAEELQKQWKNLQFRIPAGMTLKVRFDIAHDGTIVKKDIVGSNIIINPSITTTILKTEKLPEPPSKEKLPYPIAVDLSHNAESVKVQKAELDFNPYIAMVEKKVKSKWKPPSAKESRRVVVVFSIWRDGHVSGLRVDTDSPLEEVRTAATDAVSHAVPFDTLPDGAPPSIAVKLTLDHKSVPRH